MTPPFDRDAWDGKKPLAESQAARTRDDALLLDLISVGFTVWEKQDDPDALTIRGGTVVEVKDVGGTPVYEVLEWHHGEPRYIELSRFELDPQLLELPVASRLRSHARRLQTLAGRKKGNVTPFELKCSTTALRLLEVIA